MAWPRLTMRDCTRKMYVYDTSVKCLSYIMIVRVELDGLHKYLIP
jgi:hypothetical protein